MARVHGALVVVLLVLSSLLAAPGSSAQPPAEPSVDCQVLTPAQMAALLLGVPTSQTAAGEQLRQATAAHAGTVVLLGGAIADAQQVQGLIASLDDAARGGGMPGALIAVDEEGGRVARFGRSGVTTLLPSARQQAVTRSVAQTAEDAAGLGSQLAALGVDVNLAPVLDLFDGDARTVIGDRSYSADAATAGAYGRAFAEGMQASGVATVGKHFPDHGMTAIDTHRAVAVVDVAVETLRGRHLEPYRIALDRLDAIMLSHLRIPALTGDRPATLSPAAVTMIRDELGFDGAILTDDLSMQAVASAFDQPTAALLAIQAGADLALLGSVAAAAPAHASLTAALADGSLALERVRGAARRVLELHGIRGAEASCMLGLPPISSAQLVTNSSGERFEVTAEGRRLLPDAETAVARTGSADPVRYSDAEVAGLDLHAAVPSVRRFSFAVVAEPGGRPFDLAVARAVLERAGGWPHVVVVAPGPDAAAAAALVDPDTVVLPVDAQTSAGQVLAALTQMSTGDGHVSAVGTAAAALAAEGLPAGRSLTRLEAPSASGLDVAVAREVVSRRGTPPLAVVISATVDAGALLSWLAADGIVLLRHGSDTEEVLADLRAAGTVVRTIGLPGGTPADGEPLPTPDGRLSLTPALTANFGRTPVAGGWRGAETTTVLIHDAPAEVGHASGWLLASLPLAARSRALLLPAVGGQLHPLDRAQLGLLRLVGDAESTAFLAGVDADGLGSLGRMTHHRR